MKNVPYQKMYEVNEHGQKVHVNPIQGSVFHQFPNRKSRRQSEPRFLNNRKGTPLTVIGKMRFKRVLQRIKVDEIKHPTGRIQVVWKKIYHYLPMTKSTVELNKKPNIKGVLKDSDKALETIG